jgi:hypothetical protein
LKTGRFFTGAMSFHPDCPLRLIDVRRHKSPHSI